MATSLYDYSPLTITNTSNNYTNEYNFSDGISFVNTYDVISTKFIAAFTDSYGSNIDILIGASSNVKIEGVDSVSMYIGNNTGLVQQYASSNDYMGNREDYLIMKSFLSNVTINGQGSNMTIIQSGDHNIAGESSAIKIQGTDKFQSVYLNDAVIMSGYGGDDQQHFGTTHSNFRFERPVIANIIEATEELIGNKVKAGAMYVSNNLFSPDLNLYKDIENIEDQKVNKVGFGFSINAKNQLELVKYSRFNDGVDTKSVSKKVAVFGNNNLNFTDTDDASYLVFDTMGISQSSGGGSNSILSPTTWQVNKDRKLYYLDNFVGINKANPEYELDVNGTISAITIHVDNLTSSNIVSEGQHVISDARLKNVIGDMDIGSCLSNIKDLGVYQYTYNSDKEQSIKTGFIAQQVESIIPNAVKIQNFSGIEDCRLIDTNTILANLVGAVKVLIDRHY